MEPPKTAHGRMVPHLYTTKRNTAFIERRKERELRKQREELLAKKGGPAMPFDTVRAMFKERMQAVMMQDRERLRRVFEEYDVERRGLLTLPQLHDAMCKLCPGMHIDRETTAELMKRFSSEPGYILFADFLVNFLGLPPDFFSMNFAAEGSKDGRKDDDSGIKEFPHDVSIERVQRTFVNRMRKRLLNVKAAMSVALKRPNDTVTHMSENDMWYLMRDQGMMITKKELREIMEHFDQNRDGKIHYEEFAHELLGLPRPPAVRHIRPYYAQRPPLSQQAQSLVQRIAVKCERAAAAPQRLHNMFKAFDKDGSGSIAYDEFQAMVREFGCQIEGGDAAASLLNRFDTEGAGSLSYSQFIGDVLGLMPRNVGGDGEAARCSTPEIVQTVTKGIKTKVFSDRDAIAKAFERFDKDHGGSLSYAEFIEGLTTLGLPISKAQARRLFHEFDVDTNGEISTLEFASNVLGTKPGSPTTAARPPATASRPPPTASRPPRTALRPPRTGASMHHRPPRTGLPPAGPVNTFPPLSHRYHNERSVHDSLLPAAGTTASLSRSRRSTQGGGPRMPPEFLPGRSKSVAGGAPPPLTRRAPTSSRAASVALLSHRAAPDNIALKTQIMKYC